MIPELSIVIPTLNEEKYLPVLLEDISKQTYTNYEVIVSDGNSDDNTLDVAKKKHCKTISCNKRSEFTQRNKGAEIARGHYLLFLDADNRVYSNAFLEKSITFFKNENLSIAGFKLIYDSEKFKYKVASFTYNITSKVGKYTHPITMTGILTKKELHNRINGFDEKHPLGGDHEYSKRISKFGKYGIIANTKLYTSVRRFEKEGLVKVHLKWIKAGLYYATGTKKETDYKFGHY